jgi:hypothetical protein
VVASVSTPLFFVRVPSNRDRTPDNGEALTITAIDSAGDRGTVLVTAAERNRVLAPTPGQLRRPLIRFSRSIVSVNSPCIGVASDCYSGGGAFRHGGDGGTAGTASIDDVTSHGFIAWRVGVGRRQGF